MTAVWLAQAAPLWAASVAIVQPAHPSPEVLVTLSRLRGELLSLGIELKAAEGLPASPSFDADAVVSVVNDTAPLAVDVWLSKVPSGRPEVTRVAVEPGTKNASETVVLRAVEVLRANLFEVGWAPRGRDERVTAPTTLVSSPAENDLFSKSTPTIGLEAGGVVLFSLDGVGPAFLPTIRGRWVLRPRLIFQVALAGLGTRPNVTTSIGSARVSQRYGLAGACYRFRGEQRIWPFFSLSFGGLQTSVVGQANSASADADRDSQWSLLIEGGMGIGLRLGERVFATLAAHMHVATPYLAIRFSDRVGATSGRPNVLFVFTLGTWL